VQLATAMKSTSLAEPSSLGATISNLGAQFSQMRTSLAAAKNEISRLRTELAKLRPSRKRMPKADVASLRRKVAYHCHPDRGGDTDLMSNMNTLFDYLECVEQSQKGAQR